MAVLSRSVSFLKQFTIVAYAPSATVVHTVAP